MPAAGESEILLYWIDGTDHIVAVNEAWNDFAIENGAPDLTREHVLGRSLWDYIADLPTKTLYQALIERARQSRPMDFAYRCDSPTQRRLMHMTITGEADGRIRFHVPSRGATSRSSSRCGITPARAQASPFARAAGARRSRLATATGSKWMLRLTFWDCWRNACCRRSRTRSVPPVTRG